MPDSARRQTSLTLDRHLLDEARALRVNLSRAAEAGLQQAVQAARARAWQEEHRDALEAYNRMIAEGRPPLSEFRKF